jgi:hypothetical protein
MNIKRILLIKHEFDSGDDIDNLTPWARKYGRELIEEIITQEYTISNLRNENKISVLVQKLRELVVEVIKSGH